MEPRAVTDTVRATFPLASAMIMKLVRGVAALGAVLFVGAWISACGGGVPGDAVVNVGGTPITKASFDHWMGIAAAGSAASEAKTGAKPAVPEPPEFTACIAHLEAAAARTSKGKTKSNPALYKSQCEQEYNAYKQEVLSFLISSQWVVGEAEERGVSVSEAEVKKQFDTLKSQQFPKESAFKEYLARTGETEADLVMRVKLQLLARKIEEKITKSAKKHPSKAEIAKYYEAHKSDFGKPERRNLQIILTKTESGAKAAKAEVEGGKSFATVAKAVSLDPLSKNNGGSLPEVSRGEEEKALNEAVFAAKTGVLSGPVKTPFGYYIFKVTKVLPSTQQSLSQAESAVAQQISSQGSQHALSAFVEEFKKKWTAKTECRSGYVAPDCKEYKTKTSSSTSASATGSGEAE
jgi:foldase protein PrsA